MEREHSPERIPHPKKRGRRTVRRILNIWARYALLALFIGALGVGAFGLAAKIVRPYREAQRQTRQLRVARAQAAALDSDNDALRQRIAHLKTPEGEMEAARKMGYVRPGEIPFVVESTMAPPAEPAMAFPAPTLPDRSPGAETRRLLRRATHLWRTEHH